MAALDFSGGLTKTLMPWATFSDSEKMAEAALAAKTLVAEVRCGAQPPAGRPESESPGASSRGVPPL